MLENTFILVLSKTALVLKESKYLINLACCSSTIKDKADEGRC